MEAFHNLPDYVQQDVKRTLGCYNECHVWIRGDKYSVVCHVGISSTKTEEEFVGTYKAEDILTADERLIAYVNNFASYPINYRGVKDWPAINEFIINIDKCALDPEGNVIFPTLRNEGNVNEQK